MLEKSRLIVIIPAFDEANSIAAVVGDVRTHMPRAEIVVIDDGCRDGTAGIARRAGATVICLPYNLGISAAVQTGYRYAAPLFDIVVRVDGDGQHDPASIADLCAPLLAGQADFVVGSRFASPSAYRSTPGRAAGIRVFSFLVSLVTRRRFSDSTSGFCACTASTARFLARNMPSDYPEIEGLVLLCRAGYRVQEVGVAMRPRQSGRSSIGRLRSVYYVAKVTVAVLIGLLRPRPAREDGGI